MHPDLDTQRDALKAALAVRTDRKFKVTRFQLEGKGLDDGPRLANNRGRRDMSGLYLVTMLPFTIPLLIFATLMALVGRIRGRSPGWFFLRDRRGLLDRGMVDHGGSRSRAG